MLAPYLADEHTPPAFREMMTASPVPTALVPAAIDDTTAAALRARLATAGLTPYALADRGRHGYNDTLRVDPLWDELAHFAAGIAGAPVALARARWLVQRRGDYSLVKDDAKTRPPGRVLELVLDLSPGASGGAEAVYLDGTRAQAVLQLGGVLAVIDRTPTSTRYLRPPTVRSMGGFDVVRLFMQFQTVPT